MATTKRRRLMELCEYRDVPRYLFLLRHNGGGYVMAIDGACDVMMAFDNEDDARNEAVRQNEMYDLDCKVVRVK